METGNCQILPDDIPEFLVFLWGMETWRLGRGYALKVMVFSLPMRDGNSEQISRQVASARVFSLPMRDGNSMSALSFIQQKKVFSLPMRDGNMYLAMSPKALFPAFLVFLWGMEIPVDFGIGHIHELVFSLPMRDGNLQNRRKKRALNSVFSLPMRDESQRCFYAIRLCWPGFGFLKK